MQRTDDTFYIDTFLDVNPKTHLLTTCNLSPESVDFSMEAFDFVLNALPKVRVVEENGVIKVGGFWAKDLSGDVHKAWGSQRVTNSIFLTLSARSLSFHSFFVVEVLYILDALKNKGKRRTAVKTIEELESAIYDASWLKVAQDNPALPYNMDNIKRRMTATPLSAQEAFIKSYCENTPKLNLKGSIIAAPPGTGKTLAGFFLGEALDKDVMVFIVPKNSTETIWEATINKFYKRVPSYWISTSKAGPTGKEDVIICHYESLERLLPIAHKLTRKNSLLWLDESHHFNEATASRTQNFIALNKAMDANDTVWASGTPLKAIGNEAVPVLSTIDPLFTKEVQGAFVGIFGATKGRALDIFAHRLSKIMFRPEKSETIVSEVEDYTLKLKPDNWQEFTLDAVTAKVKAFVMERLAHYKEEMPRITTQVNADIERFKQYYRKDEELLNDLRAYERYITQMHRRFNFDDHRDWIPWCKRFEKHFEVFMSNEEIKAFRKYIAVYKYVVLVVRGEALGLIVTRIRINAVKAMVPHVPWKKIIDDAEKKVLIFTNYVEVLETVTSHVKALGYEPVSVYGKNNNELTQTKRRIVKAPRINPVVATYKSLSSAVEMIECNVEVFMDVPFRDYIFTQARGRIDRVGQDAKLHYITVLMDTGNLNNITKRSMDIMKWSKEMVDSMMGVNVEEEVSLESLDRELMVTEEVLENYSVTELTKKDVWYQPLFDIPSSYFHSGVRYGG